FLGIEKCMEKANEGIGSKGFMKRSQRVEEVASEVASSKLATITICEVASEVAHATSWE
ncbi:hypothetical protein PIB30_069955, partial [Stylosanthes scabra]|nr:hypothetical protein [Stylosanthes scabra]